MKMHRWLVLGLLAFAALAIVTATVTVPSTPGMAQAGCEPGKLATKYPSLASKTIRIAIAPDIPPYTYRDPKNFNNIIGIDADFARAVFKCVGARYEFFPGNWSGLLPAVIAGQADVMWTDLYYTPERGKQADYVMYLQAATGALVKKGNPNHFKSFDDLCGTQGAAGLGTVEEAALRDQAKKCAAAGKKDINIFTTPDIASAIRLIENGRAQVYLTDLGLVDRAAALNPRTLERAFFALTGFKIGAAVKKGNVDLLNAIYDGMKVLQADGTQTKIMKSYNVDPTLELPIQKLTE